MIRYTRLYYYLYILKALYAYTAQPRRDLAGDVILELDRLELVKLRRSMWDVAKQRRIKLATLITSVHVT